MHRKRCQVSFTWCPSLVLPAVTEVPAESGAKAGVHVGCWGCPRGALGEGERGPLMVAPPGRRASEGEAGGTILCLLSQTPILLLLATDVAVITMGLLMVAELFPGPAPSC